MQTPQKETIPTEKKNQGAAIYSFRDGIHLFHKDVPMSWGDFMIPFLPKKHKDGFTHPKNSWKSIGVSRRKNPWSLPLGVRRSRQKITSSTENTQHCHVDFWIHPKVRFLGSLSPHRGFDDLKIVRLLFFSVQIHVTPGNLTLPHPEKLVLGRPKLTLLLGFKFMNFSGFPAVYTSKGWYLFLGETQRQRKTGKENVLLTFWGC